MMSSQQVRKHLSHKRCNSQQLRCAAIPAAKCGVWMKLEFVSFLSKVFFSLLTKTSAQARNSPPKLGDSAVGNAMNGVLLLWECFNPLLGTPGAFGCWDFREG